MRVIAILLSCLILVNIILAEHVSVSVNVNGNSRAKLQELKAKTKPINNDNSAIRLVKSAGEASLLVGQVLNSDQCIVSGNQQYKACVQSDCNFVVYTSSNRALWHTQTNGKGSGCHLDVQSDNNMVLYDSSWNALWNTASHDKGPHGTGYLVMQDDGNLVLYQGHNPANPIWDAWSANGGDYTKSSNGGGSNGGGSNGNYPSTFATSGFTYRGNRARTLHRLKQEADASPTTYNGHSCSSGAGSCPLDSADLWTSGAAYAKNNGNMAGMNNLANYIVQHMDELGIDYVIWKQRIYGTWDRRWKQMENRGSITQNHFDHVHITFKSGY